MKLIKVALLSGFVGLVVIQNSFAQLYDPNQGKGLDRIGIFPGTYSQRYGTSNPPLSSTLRHDAPNAPAWTNTFYDMTGFDSKWYGGNTSKPAYQEFYFKIENNPLSLDPKYADMNFRLLMPPGYNANENYNYPMIVMYHGAGERANCWGSSCYASFNSDGSFKPTPDLKYRNNDANLSIGGSLHLDAVYLANGKKAEDPTLNSRAFPGFVVYPQMHDGWFDGDLNATEWMIRKLVATYKIDPNRIYVHGLSDGGGAVWSMLRKRPDLFAAALPMSSTKSHSDFTPDFTDWTAEIPVWQFQGGVDTRPNPYDTYQLVEKFRMGGGVIKYTIYPKTGHGTWTQAYAEPDFFSWMLRQNKSNVHVYFGDSTTCATNGQGVKLGLSRGFLAYQWEKDGVLIAGANDSKLNVSQPGVYRARFSRVASPTEAQWNQWSKPVLIKESNPVTPVIAAVTSSHFPDINGAPSVQISGPTQGSLIKNWYKNGVLISDTTKIITKQPGDAGKYTLITKTVDGCPSLPSNPVYVTSNNPATISAPTNFRGTATSSNSIQLFWTDNSSNETNFEIYRANNPSGPYMYMGLLPEDAISYHATGLSPNSTYYFNLRAVSPTAKSAYTGNITISTPADNVAPTAPQNFIATKIDVTSIALSWTASTDNTAIWQYVIYNAGVQIAATGNSNTTYTLTGLTSNANYALTVKGFDMGGNPSQPSNQINVSTVFNGLDYELSEGAYETLAAVDWNKEEISGHVNNLGVEQKVQDDFFYFKFHGYLRVAESGNYKFRLRSDDGSAMYMGAANTAYFKGAGGTFNPAPASFTQNRIVTRDGLVACGPSAESASIALDATSFYPIAVLFFEYGGGECISAEYSKQNGTSWTGWTTIPNSMLTSGSSQVLPSAPGIPGGLAIATSPATTMTSISLQWNAVTTNPVTPISYQLYRSTDNVTFAPVATVSGLTYTDNSLVPNSTYHYKVRSMNVNGSSDLSAAVSKLTLPDTGAPTVPASLTIASKTYTNVALQWNASSDNVGVTGYKIFSGATLIGTSPVTTFTITDLTPNTLYTFTVKAIDASGNESAASSPASVTTDPPQVFYTAPSGSITQLSTWNTSPDGSGVAPSSFSNNGQYYKITRNVTISSAWDIGGSTSKVIIDNNVAVTIASGGLINGKIAMNENAALTVTSSVAPVLETLSPTSTVIFNTYDANNSVPAARYGNLTLNGVGLKKITGSTLEVTGNLTLANGVGITGMANNGTTIMITGDLVTGASVPAASPDGRVSIQFTDNITHSITTGTSQFFHKLTANTGATVVFDDASSTTPVTLNLGSFNSNGGLELATGSVLDIRNNTLALNGNAAINATNTTGRIASDHGNIQLASTSSSNSNLYFLPAANNVEVFTLDATGTGRAYVRDAVNIYDGLSINNGVLESLGNIRIKSSATASASIREIKNGGSIVGAVVVERYMTPKFGYRYLSSAVENVKVADWQTVMAIKGNFSGASSSGTASLYWYNEPTGGYVAFPPAGGSNQTQFVKGRGYSINIMENNAKTLVTTGTPNQGNINFTLTAGTGSNANGWNLLGNPYASDIVWNNTGWTSTNVGPTVWVRQNSADGSFVWKTWNRNTNMGTLENGKIPAGQAFWVQTSTTPSLVVKENAKTTEGSTQNTEFYRISTEATPNMLSVALGNGTRNDLAYVTFSSEGADTYDKLVDGVKMANTSINLSTSSSDGVALTYNDLSTTFCNKSVSLNITNVAAGNYVLRFENVENIQIANVQLVDAYLAKTISLSDISEYPVTITSDITTYKNRFSLSFTRPDVVASYTLSSDTKLVCNTDQSVEVTLSGSQAGVVYEAINTQENSISASITGTGGKINLIVPATSLVNGENSIRIRATYPGGCSRTTFDNTVSVTKSVTPETTVDVSDVYACIGEEITLSAKGTGNTYRWIDASQNVTLGETGNTITIPSITNERSVYYISAVNGVGCESSKELISILADSPEKPTISLEDDVLVTTVHSENLQWFIDGNIIPEATTSLYRPTMPGKYTITNYGTYCSKVSEPFEYLITGLTNSEKQFNMKAYPNPSENGKVNIVGFSSNNTALKCKIVDMVGKSLVEKTISYDDFETGVTVADQMSVGMYIVQLTQNGRTIQQKILVR